MTIMKKEATVLKYVKLKIPGAMSGKLQRETLLPTSELLRRLKRLRLKSVLKCRMWAK